MALVPLSDGKLEIEKTDRGKPNTENKKLFRILENCILQIRWFNGSFAI